MMRVHAGEKRLDLLLDASSDFPRFVRSDPTKVRQVLVNLIGNAVTYTEKGSVTVRLHAELMDRPQHLLLTFDVLDTGIGIAPEDQDCIFEPFVQGGSSGVHKGTGLGLSISKHFVELMGGAIHVESAPGTGSLFLVELPVERAEQSEVEAGKIDCREITGLAPGQPEYRILIVEDRRENWLLLERLLQNAGFHVRVAQDGAQGIEIFRGWRPHLIYMDMRLPIIGGLEAARRIRATQGGEHVKIVAITASAFARDREKVLAAGMDDLVRKPYRQEEILDCLARQLGVRYVYKENTPASPEHSVPVSVEALATLPEGRRAELENALISLDAVRIAAAIHSVSDYDPVLGGELARSAERLAYTPILETLEACRSNSAEGRL
jgi:CheY-like chemotaxis protein